MDNCAACCEILQRLVRHLKHCNILVFVRGMTKAFFMPKTRQSAALATNLSNTYDGREQNLSLYGGRYLSSQFCISHTGKSMALTAAWTPSVESDSSYSSRQAWSTWIITTMPHNSNDQQLLASTSLCIASMPPMPNYSNTGGGSIKVKEVRE